MSRDFIFHRKRDKLTSCGFRRMLVALESLGIAGHSVPRESQLIYEESLAFLNSKYSQMKKQNRNQSGFQDLQFSIQVLGIFVADVLF